MSVRTPVAFLIFNRPEQTKRVFAEIARARPSQLLVVADGPRPGHPTDVSRVEQARAVVANVNWPCDVLKNYSEVNLGMRTREATGFDWVFQTVDEAILLEDDCLPHPTFFGFCDELLARYRDDERVMMIGGVNYGRRVTTDSYLFSRYIATWGWASWRRAWRHYDVTIRDWPLLRSTPFLARATGSRTYAAFWRHHLDRIAAGKLDTWDYQWQLACWRHRGFCVIPSTNLISNIGFTPDATLTIAPNPVLSNVPRWPMKFPLEHPPAVERNPEYDEFYARQGFRSGGWLNRIRRIWPGLAPGPLSRLRQSFVRPFSGNDQPSA